MDDPCNGFAHDYENAKVKGRATWICPRCQEDISLAYVFWYEAAHENELKELDHEKN